MSDNEWAVLEGDCLELLKKCPDLHFDSMVCDPPAGIGFMHKEWDTFTKDEFIIFLRDRLNEAYRTLKPGAHILVWALPRTSHWTATAIEAAGFEIRDCLTHIFATGFPKSKDLGHGVGTSLKPGYEHWILARRPVIGTITGNYQAFHTGGLNIDTCRIDRAVDDVPGWHKSGADGSKGFQGENTFKIREMSAEEIQERCGDKGRFPANLLLSHAEGCDEECVPECAVAVLNEQAGIRKSGKMKAGTQRKNRTGFNAPMPATTGAETHGDSGALSRYFPTFHYFPKPSKKEREAGLEDQPTKIFNRVNPGGLENDPRWAPQERKNNHPTVKAVALMEWLVKLITPEGGIVLDPFCGSGSTGIAAVKLGYQFVGMELDPEYCKIARDRIAYIENQDF